MADWLSLKSGSDVRGTAVGENATLTADIAQALGMAFSQWVAAKKNKPAQELTIAVGRDSRITGPALLEAVSDGISRSGASVADFGMCTTPAMYMSTITPGFEADGAVMITASHHPWDKNGLKFFTSEGGLEGKDVETLLRVARDLKPGDSEPTGSVHSAEFLPVYQRQLADRIRNGLGSDADQPLTGLHVVVDAGNGAGGFYADMLQSLGANTAGSQFLDPDGIFPASAPTTSPR